MLKRVGQTVDPAGAVVSIGEADFPAPFVSGLEYASPARGAWNIVHTGMLLPEGHEIFVCAAGCLRGVVLTAAEMGASERFSTIAVREQDLLDGSLEDLIIEGVSDILQKLPRRPPAVLVYTSCVHHFAGCDLEMVYAVLRKRFPEVDFTDCYMNPILRKSGLTPDQLMRRQLYSLLKPRERHPKTVAILGNDYPTDPNSELLSLLTENGFTVREITSCKTYAAYQEMAESAWYITCYPAARAGGEALSTRLGGQHLYLPFSVDPDEIERHYAVLTEALGIAQPDFTQKRQQCRAALAKAKALIGDTPIAIDYVAVPRPLGLARLLTEAGFHVARVYADSFSAEEERDFQWLKETHPELEIYAVVHAKMRFLAEKGPSRWLAIGQKAAHFTGTNHFVNIVEGGGLYGFAAIVTLCQQMEDAFLHEKEMRSLIQIKGMGCGGCI